MQYREQTPKKWKLLLLIGRPLAFAGLLLAGYAFLHGPQSGTLGGVGILLVLAGFVAGWAGKIGAYWFHG